MHSRQIRLSPEQLHKIIDPCCMAFDTVSLELNQMTDVLNQQDRRDSEQALIS